MINLLQTTHERLDIFVLNRKIDNIHAIYYFSEDIHTIVIFIRFLHNVCHKNNYKQFEQLKNMNYVFNVTNLIILMAFVQDLLLILAVKRYP